MALGLWVPARYKKASWMVGAAVALVVLYFYLSPYHM
jgi:hypothetical protein